MHCAPTLFRLDAMALSEKNGEMGSSYLVYYRDIYQGTPSRPLDLMPMRDYTISFVSVFNDLLATSNYSESE